MKELLIQTANGTFIREMDGRTYKDRPATEEEIKRILNGK